MKNQNAYLSLSDQEASCSTSYSTTQAPMCERDKSDFNCLLEPLVTFWREFSRQMLQECRTWAFWTACVLGFGNASRCAVVMKNGSCHLIWRKSVKTLFCTYYTGKKSQILVFCCMVRLYIRPMPYGNSYAINCQTRSWPKSHTRDQRFCWDCWRTTLSKHWCNCYRGKCLNTCRFPCVCSCIIYVSKAHLPRTKSAKWAQLRSCL